MQSAAFFHCFRPVHARDDPCNDRDINLPVFCSSRWALLSVGHTVLVSNQIRISLFSTCVPLAACSGSILYGLSSPSYSCCRSFFPSAAFWTEKGTVPRHVSGRADDRDWSGRRDPPVLERLPWPQEQGRERLGRPLVPRWCWHQMRRSLHRVSRCCARTPYVLVRFTPARAP